MASSKTLPEYITMKIKSVGARCAVWPFPDSADISGVNCELGHVKVILTDMYMTIGLYHYFTNCSIVTTATSVLIVSHSKVSKDLSWSMGKRNPLNG